MDNSLSRFLTIRPFRPPPPPTKRGEGRIEEKKMMGDCLLLRGFPIRFQAEGLPLPHFPPFSSGALFPHRAKCHMRVRSQLSSNIDRPSLKKDRRKKRGICRESKRGREREPGWGWGYPCRQPGHASFPSASLQPYLLLHIHHTKVQLTFQS